MELYNNNDVSISLIEEEDIEDVIKLFSSNTFNVDFGNSIRPTNYEFEQIIRENMQKEKKLDTVLVLKEKGVFCGYLSCFVEFSRLVLGHIAVSLEYQHNGYGRLLTLVALYLASKQNRDVSCVCYYPNKYLKSLGFRSIDDVSYLFEGRLDYPEGIPDIFISIEEYKEIKDKEYEKEIQAFKDFLDSDFGLFLKNL